MHKFSIFEIFEFYALVFFVSVRATAIRALLLIKTGQWELTEKTNTVFVQACGRRSKKSKLREKAYFLKQEEKIKVYRNGKMKYQLVRKLFSARGVFLKANFFIRS